MPPGVSGNLETCLGISMQSGAALIDFSKPEAVEGWLLIDDRVMGGVSRSQMRHDPAGFAVFAGEVSLERGGGFASVRCADFRIGEDAHALLLEVRGGKRYKLHLRTDDGLGGINYQAAF